MLAAAEASMVENRKYFVLLVILTICSTCLAIKGYDFGDNKMNKRMGPDNGILRAEMSGYIPSTLTIAVLRPIQQTWGSVRPDRSLYSL